MRSTGEIAAWLAQRIAEVERMTKTMPSIAVLVNSEDDVGAMAQALDVALESKGCFSSPISEGRAKPMGGNARLLPLEKR